MLRDAPHIESLSKGNYKFEYAVGLRLTMLQIHVIRPKVKSIYNISKDQNKNQYVFKDVILLFLF